MNDAMRFQEQRAAAVSLDSPPPAAVREVSPRGVTQHLPQLSQSQSAIGMADVKSRPSSTSVNQHVDIAVLSLLSSAPSHTPLSLHPQSLCSCLAAGVVDTAACVHDATGCFGAALCYPQFPFVYSVLRCNMFVLPVYYVSVWSFWSLVSSQPADLRLFGCSTSLHRLLGFLPTVATLLYNFTELHVTLRQPEALFNTILDRRYSAVNIVMHTAI